MADPTEIRSSPPETAVATEDEPKINGRYRLLRKLGRGGMGTVYLVVDEGDGDRQLALKRVRTDRLDKKAVAILRNEFLALSRVHHPGLAEVYDFGIDRVSSDYFFTCEYVDGLTFLKACRSLALETQSDLESFGALLSQILRALEFIHAHGLVHGDIKPENILVAHLGSNGRPRVDPAPAAKLIDFGLTRREKEFGGKKIIGTTFYIAPETISGSQVDRRTDLYSLGCVLYHVVTGALPFGGESNIAILKGHMERTPVDPSKLRPGIPSALGELILRSMAKRPSDRYASAAAVLAALGNALGVEYPLETTETARSYLLSAPVAQASGELGTLARVFAEGCKVDLGEIDADLAPPAVGALAATPARSASIATLPPARTILIRGERGIGKRRLVRAFKNIVQTQGALHLVVDCAAERGGPPGADFLRLLAALRSLAIHDDEVLVPIAKAAELAAGPALIQDEGRAAIRELAGFLLAASQEYPVVLQVHQLELAGKSLVEFVRATVALQLERCVPCNRLLVVATAGERVDLDGTEAETLLRQGLFRNSVLDLVLGRLDREGVESFLTRVFPFNDFPAGFLARVMEESDGNPEVILEVCDHCLEAGLLRRTPSGWTLVGEYLGAAIPGRMRRELEEKIARLSPESYRLAAAFAVLGNETEMELAMKLADLPRDAVLGAMKNLHRERILEEDFSQGRLNVYSFVHSSARDTLYRRIPGEERASIHERAGRLGLEFYRSLGQENPRKLAPHFLRASNPEEGIRQGILAARSYAEESQPGKAVELYEEVLGLCEGDPPQAKKLRFEVAMLLYSMGEYRSAVEVLSALPGDLVRDGHPPAPTQVLVELATNHVRLGAFPDAVRCLDRAAGLEKSQLIPVWMVHVLLGYAEYHAAQGRAGESLRFCDQILQNREQIHDKRLLVRLYRLCSENHQDLDRADLAVAVVEEGLKVADSRTDSRFLDWVFLFMGDFYRLRGRFTRAAREYQLCVELRRKRGYLDAQAEALYELGRTNLILERNKEAGRILQEACGLQEKTGNVVARSRTLNALAESHAALGEYEDARRVVTEVMRLTKTTGNSTLAMGGYAVCGRICLDHGDRESALEYFDAVEAGVRDDSALGAKALEARAELAWTRGEFPRVLDLASRGQDLARRAGGRLRALPFLRRRACVELRLGMTVDARRAAESVNDVARRSGLAVEQARAQYLLGLVHAAERRQEDASRALHRAAEVFKAEGSERDLIPLYIDYGTMLLGSGQIEQAFLHLEEASYLSKKHNLSYWKCRVNMAMGLLESRMGEGDLSKARDLYRLALRQAGHGGFLDLAWQVHLQLGRLAQKCRDDRQSLEHFVQALEIRGNLARGMTEAMGRAFVGASDGADLEGLVLEAKHRLTLESSSASSAGADAGGGPHAPVGYFGLIGTSGSLECVIERLRSLRRNAPWTWILGPAGSGKKETARVVHRQFFRGTGAVWTLEAESLDASRLEAAFQELETRRAASGGRSAEGQYTFIVVHADLLPTVLQSALWARARDEAGEPGGLRVVATIRTGVNSLPRGLAPELVTVHAPCVVLPGLLDRWADVPLLWEHFRKGFPGGEKGPALPTPEQLEGLRRRAWPANLESLRDFVRSGGLSATPTGTGP